MTDQDDEKQWTGRIEEGGTQDEGQIFELAAGDIDESALPTPNLTPEDILREEVMNRRQRQRKHSDTYGRVERNW